MLAASTPPTDPEVSPPAAPDAGHGQRWQLCFVVPMFSLVGIGMLQFAWLLAAEHALRSATEAGAREALLPKATLRSVAHAVQYELAGRAWAHCVDPPRITVNGRSTVAAIAPCRGDEVVLLVSVDACAAAPDLLRCVGLPLAGLKLTAQSRVTMP